MPQASNERDPKQDKSLVQDPILKAKDLIQIQLDAAGVTGLAKEHILENTEAFVKSKATFGGLLMGGTCYPIYLEARSESYSVGIDPMIGLEREVVRSNYSSELEAAFKAGTSKREAENLIIAYDALKLAAGFQGVFGVFGVEGVANDVEAITHKKAKELAPELEVSFLNTTEGIQLVLKSNQSKVTISGSKMVMDKLPDEFIKAAEDPAAKHIVGIGTCGLRAFYLAAICNEAATPGMLNARGRLLKFGTPSKDPAVMTFLCEAYEKIDNATNPLFGRAGNSNAKTF